jgi:hypothetical protein
MRRRSLEGWRRLSWYLEGRVCWWRSWKEVRKTLFSAQHQITVFLFISL